MITDVSIGTIRRYLSATLEELSLNWDLENITYEGLVELKSMPQLKFLNLEGSNLIIDEAAEFLKHELPHLTLRFRGQEIIQSQPHPLG